VLSGRIVGRLVYVEECERVKCCVYMCIYPALLSQACYRLACCGYVLIHGRCQVTFVLQQAQRDTI
jgi:hypothetical protein